MTLKISPRAKLDNMVSGEEIAYTINITKELGSNTVDSYTYKIYDSDDVEKTDDFGGGDSISNGVITFGLIAYATGTYTLKFWVTCAESLPDTTTPYEFTFEMTVVIE